MIDRKKLLDDLKTLLKAIEADLRDQSDQSGIDTDLHIEYEEARTADRTTLTFQNWRADLITQVAVAWVLSCVFVRFLEDNTLIFPPQLSGPLHGSGTDAGLSRARDERDQYFTSHPTHSDADYLSHIFNQLAQTKASGINEVFGPHNAAMLYPHWLSGDAGRLLVEFFHKIDADHTGQLIHDFTDPNWDTRFLGDLYQDLSVAAREKYKLWQTPVFVEEFILDRTLEPALATFTLQPTGSTSKTPETFKIIDPACGSGHFVLGAFARLLTHWRKHDPTGNDRQQVNRALASVHGVDVNPYAIAIARFRLLIAAMRECHIHKLADAPAFVFNLACGDSLLHGPRVAPDDTNTAAGASGDQTGFDFTETAHHYAVEDAESLHHLLTPGRYHAVVANPPYTTAKDMKDKALNQAYRIRYPQVCYGLYSLALPFLQRLFQLAVPGGFTGQITANSFMKREFGKKLVESYLPQIDLSHVLDTSGAYIPGHATPTVILFGRSRAPVASTIRTVMGITGEPFTPADPAHGQVWTAIVEQIDQPGSQSPFVSVNDTPREQFAKYPWSIGGGGTAELKKQLDKQREQVLDHFSDSIGFVCITKADEFFQQAESALLRKQCEVSFIRPFGIGKEIRDWCTTPSDFVIFPYDVDVQTAPLHSMSKIAKQAWRCRTELGNRMVFGNQNYFQANKPWYEYGQIPVDRMRIPLSIVFGEIATHNHFVLDRGGKIFNRTAPVIKLPAETNEDDHLALIGLLNSSVALFWLRQTCFPKKGSSDSKWEERLSINGANVGQIPLPAGRPLTLARLIDTLAQQLSAVLPATLVKQGVPSAARLEQARQQAQDIQQQMITLQEELDWTCYGLYGLIENPPVWPEENLDQLPPIALGQRAFEISLARQIEAGEEETAWFTRHNSTPVTTLPDHWPAEYVELVERRLEVMSEDDNIGLIERPEYKRRWNAEPWEKQQEQALQSWLLDRLESYFDIDGRMNDTGKPTANALLTEPVLTSVAKLADVARVDEDFMQVADIYTGQPGFDVAKLVEKLVTDQSVPALPVQRYKPAGLDKRQAWEDTWQLQRIEDEIEAILTPKRLAKLIGENDADMAKVQAVLSGEVAQLAVKDEKQAGVLRKAMSAAQKVADILKNKLNLEKEDVVANVLLDLNQAKKAAVGDIAVPPKYASTDFVSAAYWKLRGKLDVPKERWVSFPDCEGPDQSLVIAWAGYDHLQMAKAIAERFELARENEGLVLPGLLAGLGQLLPWLKQWHNELDADYGLRMGDYYEEYLHQEAQKLGQPLAEVLSWQPAAKAGGKGKKKK